MKQAKVKEYERQIDQMVYELYELNDKVPIPRWVRDKFASIIFSFNEAKK